MKGIESKVWEVLLMLGVFAILALLAVAISGGLNESSNPLLNLLKDVAAVFK